MQSIEQLWTPDAEPRIQKDLEEPGEVWILVYNLDLNFFHRVFEPYKKRHTIRILADRTQRQPLAILKSSHPEIDSRIWSRAWVMHAKAVVLPNIGICYVGSPNFTSYSYRRALNLTLRIESAAFTEILRSEVDRRWRVSKPVE